MTIIRVNLKGSKSFTNRALILSALANGESKIINPAEGDDVSTMISALEILGAKIIKDNDGNLSVTPLNRKIFSKKAKASFEICVGAAGTTMRFLTALCASISGLEVILSGSDRMHKRPISGLVDALRILGAEIYYLKEEGCPPLKIFGRELKGGVVSIDGSLSSQFLTALMLIGGTLEEGLILLPQGELVSRSYLGMTAETLKAFSVESFEREDGAFLVEPSVIKPANYTVEADGSGASYFFALAAATGKSVVVGPFNPDSTQGDLKFPSILEEMGCKVDYDKDSFMWQVTPPSSGVLRSVDVNMEDMPDVAQTLAALAAIANGETVIRGLKTLKVKETDRLSAMVEELKKCGVKAEAGSDYLRVKGVLRSELKAAEIKTYDDHRMAMSFAVLKSVFPSLKILDPNVVSKSFPDFWEKAALFGVKPE